MIRKRAVSLKATAALIFFEGFTIGPFSSFIYPKKGFYNKLVIIPFFEKKLVNIP